MINLLSLALSRRQFTRYSRLNSAGQETMPPTSNSHLGTTTLLPVAPLIAAAALLSSRRNPTSSISTWPALAAAPLVGLSAILFMAGVLARRRTDAMRVKPQPAKDAGNSSVHYSYKIVRSFPPITSFITHLS